MSTGQAILCEETRLHIAGKPESASEILFTCRCMLAQCLESCVVHSAIVNRRMAFKTLLEVYTVYWYTGTGGRWCVL
jgi:hypothetical protein